jgi:flagellar biosynthetic protein FlhB
MADDQDDSQKTEEPSQRKIEEAFRKGQVPFSREIGHFLMLLTLTLFVMTIMPWMMGRTGLSLSVFIHAPDLIAADSGNMLRVMMNLVKEFGLLMGIVFVCTIAMGVFATVAQTGFNVSGESIMPKLEKISLLAGFKRMFSLKSLMELIKGTFKIGIIGYIAYKLLLPHLVGLGMLPSFDLPDMFKFVMSLTLRLLMWTCVLMFVIAAADLLYQRFEFFKSLRMSREEMKKEYKDTQGDPVIKARIRQIRQERAKKRMMSNVPKANVIITNPEHYAVALQYEGDMRAPVVVAKGTDLVAMKIREVATANNIPIVQNPPLARALHAAVDIDEEIPTQHYQAVAEVISYVMGLKRPKASNARF